MEYAETKAHVSGVVQSDQKKILPARTSIVTMSDESSELVLPNLDPERQTTTYSPAKLVASCMPFEGKSPGRKRTARKSAVCLQEQVTYMELLDDSARKSKEGDESVQSEATTPANAATSDVTIGSMLPPNINAQPRSIAAARLPIKENQAPPTFKKVANTEEPSTSLVPPVVAVANTQPLSSSLVPPMLSVTTSEARLNLNAPSSLSFADQSALSILAEASLQRSVLDSDVSMQERWLSSTPIDSAHRPPIVPHRPPLQSKENTAAVTKKSNTTKTQAAVNKKHGDLVRSGKHHERIKSAPHQISKLSNRAKSSRTSGDIKSSIRCSNGGIRKVTTSPGSQRIGNLRHSRTPPLGVRRKSTGGAGTSHFRHRHCSSTSSQEEGKSGPRFIEKHAKSVKSKLLSHFKEKRLSLPAGAKLPSSKYDQKGSHKPKHGSHGKQRRANEKSEHESGVKPLGETETFEHNSSEKQYETEKFKHGSTEIARSVTEKHLLHDKHKNKHESDTAEDGKNRHEKHTDKHGNKSCHEKPKAKHSHEKTSEKPVHEKHVEKRSHEKGSLDYHTHDKLRKMDDGKIQKDKPKHTDVIHTKAKKEHEMSKADSRSVRDNYTPPDLSVPNGEQSMDTENDDGVSEDNLKHHPKRSSNKRIIDQIERTPKCDKEIVASPVPPIELSNVNSPQDIFAQSPFPGQNVEKLDVSKAKATVTGSVVTSLKRQLLLRHQQSQGGNQAARDVTIESNEMSTIHHATKMDAIPVVESPDELKSSQVQTGNKEVYASSKDTEESMVTICLEDTKAENAEAASTKSPNAEKGLRGVTCGKDRFETITTSATHNDVINNGLIPAISDDVHNGGVEMTSAKTDVVNKSGLTSASHGLVVPQIVVSTEVPDVQSFLSPDPSVRDSSEHAASDQSGRKQSRRRSKSKTPKDKRCASGPQQADTIAEDVYENERIVLKLKRDQEDIASYKCVPAVTSHGRQSTHSLWPGPDKAHHTIKENLERNRHNYGGSVTSRPVLPPAHSKLEWRQTHSFTAPDVHRAAPDTRAHQPCTAIDLTCSKKDTESEMVEDKLGSEAALMQAYQCFRRGTELQFTALQTLTSCLEKQAEEMRGLREQLSAQARQREHSDRLLHQLDSCFQHTAL